MDERLRPESSSRRSPASPGKRRMVDNEKGKIRLISRGLPDSDDEDVIINQAQVVHAVPPPKDNRTLNLTTSRKRKTLDLSSNEQSVLVLPSPTTQIARQIDSIRLVGTPVYGHTNRLPMLGLAESMAPSKGNKIHPQPLPTDPLPHGGRDSSAVMDNNMETTSTPSSGQGNSQLVTNKIDMVKPTSPQYVPPIGTNIEISDNSPIVAMETYLQRPQHALNMKRTLTNDDDDRDDHDGDGGNGGQCQSEEIEEGMVVGGPRDKMTKYTHASSRSNSATPPIRVSTIIQSPTKSAVSPPTTSDTLHKYTQQVLPPSSVSGSFMAVPVPMSTTGTSLLSAVGPFSSSTASTSSTSPRTSTPSPIPKPPPSKVSNFSITELLAKDDSKSKPSNKPVIPQQSFATPVPPAYLSLYYQQQWYLQMLSNMKKFQGDSAEVDSTSPIRGIVGGEGSTTSSLAILSQNKPGHHLSTTPTTSPLSAGATSSGSSTSTETQPGPSSRVIPTGREHEPTQEEGNRTSNGGGVNPPRSSSSSATDENVAFNQRQNALLQVGEAHLAILPDEDGDTPLHLSIIQENIPLTFYLVRLISGVRMNLDIANNLRQTPLHLSVITRQPMITQLLVQNGASVNFPDRRGNTCVHLAAQRKNLDALQILAQANSPIPDFNCRNFAGLTPVHIATKEGSVDVLKFLFQMEANKNCADSCSGRTPLHYAVESQNLQVCNYLLESGCNVNAITFSGNTPLHVAAGRRLKDIVAVLMAYGANPAIANGEGDFPSDLPASLLVGCSRHQVICL